MITQDKLFELLRYDRETGIFTRLTDNGRGCRIGDIAGSCHGTGYINIYVAGRNYPAHHLAWLHVYGRFPFQEIDHIDGNKSFNAIGNLRECSRVINMQNETKVRKNNKSGFRGVHWRKDRATWIAQIRVNGRSVRLGAFKTKEEAQAAYLAAKRLYHPGFVK